MADAESESEYTHDDEHQVTPLELFFDLTFVFAITQVTRLLTNDPTWGGVFRAMLVLAALSWAWTLYAWLTSTLDVDEGGVRLAMLAAMGAMLGVGLAVPGAFGGDAVSSASPTWLSDFSISSCLRSSLATILAVSVCFFGSRRPRRSALG